MNFRVLNCALAMAALVLLTACLSLEPENVVDVTKAPMRLRTEAGALKGTPLEALVSAAPVTVIDLPMHTGAIRDVAQKVKTSVLSLYVRTSTPYRVRLLPILLPFGGIPVTLQGMGLGSGFIVHPDGYVITNNHVIEDADLIRGLMSDGSDVELSILARDPALDLALLKIKGEKKSYPFIPMGDSDQIQIGDFVVAVGNPLGLGHTVTAGIVSQTGRNLTGVMDVEGRRVDFLQTDTAINRGSSGGPLITLTGAWIGVNTAQAAEAQGIGFAIPSGQVKSFLLAVTKGEGESE